MSKIIINLTQHSILQEIERILERYPDHPYQQAFSQPDRRQDSLVWVLNRVPNVFKTIEDSQAAIVDLNDARYCGDQQSSVEFVIRQGIQKILIQNQQEIEHDIPEEESIEHSASHWFG